MSSPASLYFHIPFCTRKCDYCHFYVIPDREADKELLMEGFFLEWKRQLPLLQNKTIVSIYFGGGTPALLGPERIGNLLERIQRSCLITKEGCEVTLEANPENIDRALMESYAAAGTTASRPGSPGFELDSVRQIGELRVFFQSEKVMQVSIEFQVGDNIDVMLAAVDDDPPHFIFGEAAFGIEQRVSRQFNRSFTEQYANEPRQT